MKTYKAAALALGAALLLGLLAGCGAEKTPPSGEEGEKAIQIEKRDAASETVFLLEDNDAAHAFFDTYLAEDGELFPEEEVAALAPVCDYIVYQEKTVHAGETEPAGWEEILRYTLYEDSDVVTVQVAPDVSAAVDMEFVSDLLAWSYEGAPETVAYLKSCTAEEIAA